MTEYRRAHEALLARHDRANFWMTKWLEGEIRSAANRLARVEQRQSRAASNEEPMGHDEIITIDDLTEPKLDAAQRAALDYTSKLDVRFDADALLRDTQARTGCRDFGDPGFRERLDVTIAAVEADTGLNQLGRLAVHQRAERLLCARLLVEDLVGRRPEILDIELERPIIVIGLPRSGTTHLVNLMAADTRLRSLPYWESREPCPFPGEGPDRDGVDPRYERCRRDYEAQIQMVPLLRAMHHQYPSAIEEEIELEDLDFASYTLEWLARVPTWRDYYATLDQRTHYAYMKKVLQVLTFLRGPRHWVLKSPQHLEQIPALLATFPDATFAVTHRDPVSVVQSAITMLAYGDRLRRTAIDPDELAAYWIDRIAVLLDACVRDRDLLPDDRTIDVHFDEFMADDVAMVERVYRATDQLLTRVGARHEVTAHLDEHQHGRYGRLCTTSAVTSASSRAPCANGSATWTSTLSCTSGVTSLDRDGGRGRSRTGIST